MAQIPGTRSEKISTPRPRHRLFACSLWLALVGGSLVMACTPPSPELRVVLITLDTLRYDRFEGGGAEPQELLDTQTREALEALGYTH